MNVRCLFFGSFKLSEEERTERVTKTDRQTDRRNGTERNGKDAKNAHTTHTKQQNNKTKTTDNPPTGNGRGGETEKEIRDRQTDRQTARAREKRNETKRVCVVCERAERNTLHYITT